MCLTWGPLYPEFDFPLIMSINSSFIVFLFFLMDLPMIEVIIYKQIQTVFPTIQIQLTIVSLHLLQDINKYPTIISKIWIWKSPRVKHVRVCLVSLYILQVPCLVAYLTFDLINNLLCIWLIDSLLPCKNGIYVQTLTTINCISFN